MSDQTAGGDNLLMQGWGRQRSGFSLWAWLNDLSPHAGRRGGREAAQVVQGHRLGRGAAEESRRKCSRQLRSD